jgi:hypothetical protein
MTAENGFNRAPLQSTANTDGPLFTEQEFSWVHDEGIAGSGSLLIVFVGAIDTSSEKRIEALSATFEGSAQQAMVLAHEVTAGGKAFPSAHIFSLTQPTFTGTSPEAYSGIVTVRMNEVTSNINAFSVVMSGVNTTSLGFLPGSFTDRVESNITSTGTLSGTILASPGDLLVDCVIANAGLPDAHTVGTDQILDGRIFINSGGSAKMSVSHKFASTAEHTKGMQRSELTALETVSEIKFAIEMN